MRKPFVRLASKLLTLALLVGCLSVIAPSRAAKASWIDCWSDWSGCMGNCGDPRSSGFDGCWDQCDMNLMICQATSSPDDGGFKIWP